MSEPKTPVKKFAAGTRVAALSTVEQIKALLKKHGCTRTGEISDENSVNIFFEKPDSDGTTRSYRYTLYLPSANPETLKQAIANAGHTTRPRTAEEGREREVDRLHRALLMMIKGRLVGVESGIESMEQAFYSNMIVSPDGKTIYEKTNEDVTEGYRTGKMPALLPGLKRDQPVIERRIEAAK